MRILVCVKQAPQAGTGHPVTGGVPFPIGAPAYLDPFSTYALEGAARIADALPGTQITTLGLRVEEGVLRESLALAADWAYLVERAPLEPLSASRCLAQAVRSLEETDGPFDAIFCGDQSVQGDSRPLGGELAEWLGRPQVTGVLEATAWEEGFQIRRRATEGEERLWVDTPCLLAFTRPDYALRYPTMPRYLVANRSKIPRLDNCCSPPGPDAPELEVLHICPPRPKEGRIFFGAGNAETAAHRVLRALDVAGII